MSMFSQKSRSVNSGLISIVKYNQIKRQPTNSQVGAVTEDTGFSEVLRWFSLLNSASVMHLKEKKKKVNTYAHGLR